MFYLTTQSPLAATPEGFPRRAGAPYLPGSALREALLTAALAYAIQRDEAFAAEMRRLAQHAFKGSAGELADAMTAALLERQPELEALVPDDVFLPQAARCRFAVTGPADGGEPETIELECFEGRLALPRALPPELETWLAAASRSYTEVLARTGPVASPGVEALHRNVQDRRLERGTWLLRLGFWTPEPQAGRFVAFAGLAAVEQALARRFAARPLPQRLLLDPATQRPPGWALLRKER